MRLGIGVLLLLLLFPRIPDIGLSAQVRESKRPNQWQLAFIGSATARLEIKIAKDEVKLWELQTQIANANNELAAALEEQKDWAQRKNRMAELSGQIAGASARAELDREVLAAAEAEDRAVRRAKTLPPLIITAERLLAERREQVARQKTTLNEVKKNLNTADVADSLSRVVLLAATWNLDSRVSIVSIDKHSKPSPGAIVRYQTATQRYYGVEPRSSKSPTECIESLNIDEYYIWTERSNRVTSDKDRKVYIANTEEKVTLIEDR
jgi:hypothetical protein